MRFSGVFLKTTVEPAEVDKLGEVAFEAGVGGPDVCWIGKDEAAAGFEETGGGIEEVGHELAEIWNGDAFAHRWICDDEGNGAGIEVTEVGGGELGFNVLNVGGGEVSLGDFEGGGAEVCADDFGDVAEKGAFDEFEAGAAEGVPNDFVCVGGGPTLTRLAGTLAPPTTGSFGTVASSKTILVP